MQKLQRGAYPGNTVTLKPKEKAGQFVKRVIVRDRSGKEIEVSNNNTFVMPDDDVSIEVIYEKRETEPAINPDTASTISVILVLVSIVVFGTVLIRVTVLNKSMYEKIMKTLRKIFIVLLEVVLVCLMVVFILSFSVRDAVVNK